MARWFSYGLLVGALALPGRISAQAADWASLGLGSCAVVAPGAATVLYNTPRLMRQQEIGTLPPGDIYRVAGVSARYRLLRATGHAPGYKTGQIVGWVWSVRLKPEPAAACN
jgi:hypothetical protein